MFYSINVLLENAVFNFKALQIQLRLARPIKETAAATSQQALGGRRTLSGSSSWFMLSNTMNTWVLGQG